MRISNLRSLYGTGVRNKKFLDMPSHTMKNLSRRMRKLDYKKKLSSCHRICKRHPEESVTIIRANLRGAPLRISK